MVLRTEKEKQPRLDWLKWSIVGVIVLAGLLANHYYSDVSMPLRMGAWLIVLAIAGAVAATTQKGRTTIELFRDSRLELRKVVWPTRDETMQTTMVVAIMVVILALILWGLDGTLVWLIGWLTGQRG